MSGRALGGPSSARPLRPSHRGPSPGLALRGREERLPLVLEAKRPWAVSGCVGRSAALGELGLRVAEGRLSGPGSVHVGTSHLPCGPQGCHLLPAPACLRRLSLQQNPPGRIRQGPGGMWACDCAPWSRGPLLTAP